jgi:urease accessory protein
MHLDPAPIRLQRARGHAEVAVSLRGGRTRLDRLMQQGCCKALLPRTHGPVPEAVLVNTSGGVAGGDRLDWRLAVGPGAALVATTQAAERIYRATAGTARIETRLTLGAAATLDWLPQETIVFDAARLDRRLEIVMAADARLTALETIVLGRAAMGERVTTGALSDQWRIRRAGRLVHAEALHAAGDLAAATAGPATLAGARALATLVHAAPGADARLDAARALLAPLDGVTAAATAKPDLLILRFLAADARPLRAALGRFLTAFRAAPLPRVWSS